MQNTNGDSGPISKGTQPRSPFKCTPSGKYWTKLRSLQTLGALSQTRVPLSGRSSKTTAANRTYTTMTSKPPGHEPSLPISNRPGSLQPKSVTLSNFDLRFLLEVRPSPSEGDEEEEEEVRSPSPSNGDKDEEEEEKIIIDIPTRDNELPLIENVMPMDDVLSQITDDEEIDLPDQPHDHPRDEALTVQDISSRDEAIRAWIERQLDIFNELIGINDLGAYEETRSNEDWLEWVMANRLTEGSPRPITHDGMRNMVAQWTIEGFKLKWKDTPPVPNIHRSTYAKANTKMYNLLENELCKLVAKGHIELCDEAELILCHPIFGVPKSSTIRDKIRLVYDCRDLNSYLTPPPFKLPSIPKSIQSIPKNAFGFVSDVSAGYHHIPINPEYKNFFGLSWKGSFFRWTVMPFGLNVAPFIFQKWLGSYIAKFKQLHPEIHSIQQYLDDVLVVCQQQQQSHHARTALLTFYNQHNIIANIDKTTTPATTFPFLGFMINSREGTVTLGPGRQRQIDRVLTVINNAKYIPKTFLQKTLGLINWCRRGMKSVLSIQSGWYAAMKTQGRYCTPNKKVIPRLRWLLHQHVKFRLGGSPVIVASDATPLRGAWITNRRVCIFDVPKKDPPLGIFETEALAALGAIKCEAKRNNPIIVMVDNQALMYSLEKGSSKNKYVNKLLQRLWIRTELFNIKVIPIWIPTTENPADFFSRCSWKAGVWPFAHVTQET